MLNRCLPCQSSKVEVPPFENAVVLQHHWLQTTEDNFSLVGAAGLPRVHEQLVLHCCFELPGKKSDLYTSPMVTCSCPRVTYTDPKVTYSFPMVTDGWQPTLMEALGKG